MQSRQIKFSAAPLSNQRGSALVMVSIFSALILLLAAGSIAAISYQTRSTGRSIAYKQAIALAEAGAEVAITRLNTEPNSWTGWTASGSNRVLSNQSITDADGNTVGSYSVTIFNADSKTPLISSVGTAQRGSSGPVKREVRVPVKDDTVPSPFGSYGIYSKNDITVKNSSLEGNSAAEGDIYIDTTGNRKIGNLQAAGNVTVAKGKPGTVVENSAPEAPPAFPDDELDKVKLSNDNQKIYKLNQQGNKVPVNVPVSGELDFTKHGTLYFPAGTYYLKQINIGANTDIKVEGAVRIFVDPPAGENAIDFSSGRNTFNAPGNAANLQLFVKDGDINLGSNFHSYCGIYAPSSDVHFSSNTWLTGAIVANNINLEAQSGIKTVQDLLKPQSSDGFMALGWTEVAVSY